MNRRTSFADRDSAAGNPARDPPQPPQRLQALTARELEVLNVLSTGASTKAIADRLQITLPTVKRHLTNLYRKLRVTNRVQATRCYLLAEHDSSTPATSEATATRQTTPRR